MNWIPFNSVEQLSAIIQLSQAKPQVIFKHSTRCNISSIAWSRLQKGNSIADAEFYFLDLIKYRKLSDKVADHFNVTHESPQLLLIKNGNCVYNESHLAIFPEDLEEQI